MKYLLIKNALFVCLAAGLIAGGLYYYNQYRIFPENFKLFYWRAYQASINYNLSKLKTKSAESLAKLMSGEVGFKYEQRDFARPNATTEKASAGTVPVLYFRNISEQALESSPSPEKLREQLISLKSAGYQTVSLNDLASSLTGEISLPEKTFVIAFADGRKDNFYPVDPILRDLGFEAVIFINEKNLENSDYYLTPEETRFMQDSGRWDFGYRLPAKNAAINPYGEQGNYWTDKIWVAENYRLETEEEMEDRMKGVVISAKIKIENQLNIKLAAIILPSEQMQGKPLGRTIVKNFKIRFIEPNSNKGIFSQNFGHNADWAFVTPNGNWSGADLVNFLEGGRLKKLPYSARFAASDGWRRLWGDYSFSADGGLSLKTATTSGSFVILDGTGHWRDYQLEAKVKPQSGSHLTLISRLRDKDSYYGCNFNNNSVRLEKTLHGRSRLLAQTEKEALILGQQAAIGMSVVGGTVSCLLNGEPVTQMIDPVGDLLSGGIAIMNWDRQIDNSTVEIMSLETFAVSRPPKIIGLSDSHNK